MPRHGFVRLRLVAACAVLAAGLSPALPAAAAPDGPTETVVPATLRSTYLSGAIYGGSGQTGSNGAGAQGVFHSLEGSGLVWTRYADGRSVKVVHPAGYTGVSTAGGDVLAYRHADGRVDLWNAADGTTRTVRTPQGLTYLAAYDDLAVAYRDRTDEAGTRVREMHLLIPEADGSTRDVPVTGVLPEGYSLAQPKAADADGLLFVAGRPGTSGAYVWVLVDKRTGQLRSVTPPLPKPYLKAQVTADHVVLFNLNDPVVKVFSRSDLSAAPVEVTLEGAGINPAQDLAVVGDWLIHRPSAGSAVRAKPIAGGSTVTLLPSSNPSVAGVPDGAALAVGLTDSAAGDWGVQRIEPGPDGRPVVRLIKAMPKPPAAIQGISLEQGRLVVRDTGRGTRRDDYVRTVAATGTPEFGVRSDFTPWSSTQIDACPATEVACSQIFGTADGRIAWMDFGGAESYALHVNGPKDGSLWERGVPFDGRILDVSGRYVLYADPGTRFVYRIGEHGDPVARVSGAAALDGDVLWTAGTTPGNVSALNLSTGKSTTVTTDAGCKPLQLQALGRYLYWTCDGRAGVYDRTAKQSVPVPADEARLGDGYVVTHDKRTGKLTLTTVAGGTPASRVIGDLPDTGDSQREVRWTVDKAGANAAYVDDQQRVHLVPSGVPQQPLRLLGPAQSAASVEAHTIDTVPDTLTTLLLSKPSASWRLTVRSKATGKVVDTQSGGAARGELSVGWDGDDPGRTGDAWLPNGFYDWTLAVPPADGVGAPVEVRGTVRLLRGAPVGHDHVGPEGRPDGSGDLLTLNSSGALTFQQGTGKGSFSGKVSGSGWSTKAVAVPFGDLNGDRCNDVLVRMSDGSLRGYKPGCGKALTPATAYTKLGTGWNAYNVLTSPGDLTGDKRADLLARKASTGDVYLFAAKSDGTLAAGKKIRSAWTGYTTILGAGDLNGDGHGDVLARDRAGTLWRYNGVGNGLLKDRVKVFANWGTGYNAVVGPGDITGDGKADLVSRDGSGNVWRNNGDGKGSFGARVKIASGWQGYKGIF
ncbi:FG-GAP repeat domain-containing protein [Streptomyces sp. NPDC012935]|uniref:FG-GAP repeat domain-containing protein n=1 Tax=Streptomyces sp. NPDC012935 TaxID=3364857 RepID=UPI0036861304